MRSLVAVITCMCLFISCKKDRQDDTPPQLDVPFFSTDDSDHFTPFGNTAGNGNISTGYEVSFSNPDAYVVAACTGTVQQIDDRGIESGANLEIALGSRSAYKVYYQHVNRLKVNVGQIVEAGDTLGQAGPEKFIQFQVLNTKFGFYVCPQYYGNSSFNLAMERALSKQNMMHGTSYVSTCLQEKAN